MDRKLAAILAADVVGYSKLMERDEAGTFERLKATRTELFEPEIALHHGRVFKLMGDGLLAEFGSVVDAVECAVSLQRGLAERNADAPEDERFLVRIGINLGEVIVDGDDRYGEGVNIAARLQQLAEPGGIWVSGKVAREVEKKLAIGFEAMGEQAVKNIAEPVQTFRVRLDEVSSPSARPVRRAGYQSIAVMIGLLAMVAGAAAWYRLQQPALVEREPSIAVLPFVNMSGDPAQDYLGSGVAEDIITMLASFPTLRVVSRTSSFVYDKPVKVQEVGDALKVNYVLEGSVRKAGDQVRVTAQLIDASTGDHLWANRYDEEGANIAAMQDDVASKLYGTLAGLRGEVMKREEAEAWTKSSPSLGEYDYYLRGHQLFFHFTREDNERARQIWQEGLVKFPNSALLRMKLAWTYLMELENEWTSEPRSATEQAWTLAKQAEAIPDKSRLETFLFHWMMASMYQYHDGDFARSVAEAEAAVQLVPYDAFSRADLGRCLANAGETDRGIEWLEEAIRRDANPMDWYFAYLGTAYYNAGRPADAIAAYQKMKQPWDVNIAAAYARLGKLDEARASIATLLSYKPGWTIEKEALWPSGKSAQFVEPLQSDYVADLVKAGLPAK